MCHNFGNWFCESFPNETVPPKLHILIFHVPQFVTKHKSLGMFSEQGCESKHQQVKKIRKKYYCVPNPQEKLLSTLQNQMEKTSPSKSN